MEIDKSNIKSFRNIIDLRDYNNFIKKSIPGSINVSYQKLLIYPDKYLNKDKEYLLVCEYGIKSKKVCEILNRLGYHTYSLSGGIKNS